MRKTIIIKFVHLFKISIIIFLLFTINTEAKAQEYKEIHKSFKNIHIADSLLDMKKYENAIKFYKKATNSLYSETLALTKIMICYFYLGDTSKMLKYKEKVPAKLIIGVNDIDEKWSRSKDRKNVEKNINEELRAEFLNRKAKDQIYRSAPVEKSDSLRMIQKKYDLDNQRFLDSIMERHGWPGYSLIGKDGSGVAFLIAQHADNDIEFQEKCLKLMKRAFVRNDVSKPDYAYLMDRVMINKYGFQLFASQVMEVNGQFQPKPLYDKQIVTTLRKYFLLTSLENYLQFMQDGYTKKEDKKKQNEQNEN